MKKLFVIFTMLVFSTMASYAQEVTFEIQGAIQIANSQDPTPDMGTIRYNEEVHDFEGWNGFFWASLTGYRFETGTVTDIEGNVYKTIKIGDKEWMAENLRTTSYNTTPANPSDQLQEIEDPLFWSVLNFGGVCSYGNDTTYDVTHGKLYNWYAVNSSYDLCPTGWSVPSPEDYNEVIDLFDGAGEAGGAMKETGLEHWNEPNTGASNISGFTAFASGHRDLDGSYIQRGKYGYWWTRTIDGLETAHRYYLSWNNASIVQAPGNYKYGFSVRCVKD